MDHDNRGTAIRAWLHVRVERQLPGIADVPPDARNDVVAVGITGVKRTARLCERGGADCECDEEWSAHSHEEGRSRAPMNRQPRCSLDARRTGLRSHARAHRSHRINRDSLIAAATPGHDIEPGLTA